ncbi:E3 ubiquitin-protein ligase GW2 [Pelomyxa schiedti]|nr:E3 ubiquitin-protein ligase GW2 [Pelomyxa schiedti]
MGNHKSRPAKPAKTATPSSTPKPRKLSPSAVIIPPCTLYKSRAWDETAVRKLIASRVLSPAFVGDANKTPDSEECPICFLNYTGGLNRTLCCKQAICTECLLQTHPQFVTTSTLTCPICRHGMIVKYTGPLSKEERAAMELEDKKVHDLEEKMRMEEIERDREREAARKSMPTSVPTTPPPPPPPPPPPAHLDLNNEDAMMAEAIRLSLVDAYQEQYGAIPGGGGAGGGS